MNGKSEKGFEAKDGPPYEKEKISQDDFKSRDTGQGQSSVAAQRENNESSENRDIEASKMEEKNKPKKNRRNKRRAR